MTRRLAALVLTIAIALGVQACDDRAAEEATDAPVTEAIERSKNGAGRWLNAGSRVGVGLPDVTKTPAAPGPLPIPYPNIAPATTTSDGSGGTDTTNTSSNDTSNDSDNSESSSNDSADEDPAQTTD